MVEQHSEDRKERHFRIANRTRRAQHDKSLKGRAGEDHKSPQKQRVAHEMHERKREKYPLRNVGKGRYW